LSQRLHVTDLYPTFLELAGAAYPSMDGDRALEPLYGKSLLPLLRDSSLAEYAIHDEIFWAFNTTGKGLVRGDWKISSISDGPWQLFNIAKDPAESTDLAAALPEQLRAMNDRWFEFARQRTVMPPSWREPLRDRQEGWGFHRMRMVTPAFEYAEPRESAIGVPLDTGLSFTFSQPISFANSQGKAIRLYAVKDPDVSIWQADPEPGHPAEGTRTISFDDLPRLEPDTTYFILTDPHWITIGGKPARALNDGAFWYRFRTVSQ
jgi:arylsulfatase